ncbi:FAD-dependent oxidoreductase [soil metagenome]
MTTPPAFPHLLAPGRIGTMRTRNRIVMSPMETMYGSPDGLPSERTRAYFAARASGGVGLITVGATGIDHLHPETPGGLHIGTDEATVAHRALVEEVHSLGARIQPQIVHAGPDGLGPEMHGVTSLGPSVIASYLTGRPSQEIGAEQWQGVLDCYRAAATRVREAGYDGLELHAAHGYMMLGSFLAPQRNRRTDGYRGSSARGRFRAVFEALAAIRDEVGTDFPITLRVSGHERVAGGRPSYELATMAPSLVAAGVDAFHVSGGVIDRYVTQMVNGSDHGDGLNFGAAAAVREVVDVPVIAVGRLHDPALAEQVLADGLADFVALGRPLLADPDLPTKLAAARDRRVPDVRRCISCENCIDAMEIRFSVDCAVNPRTGRERELAITPTSAPRHVVVVGGGPAGLEAARVAAEHGHRVTLLEAADRLGGALVAASVVHPENAPILTWLGEQVVGAATIDVRLGVVATVDSVAALDPHVVIVATGGRLASPTVAGADLPHVVDAATWRAHLSGSLEITGRVAVLGATMAALELAETLAAAGCQVAVFEGGDTVAPEFGWKRKSEHLDRLDRLRVTLHTGANVEQIVPEGLVLTPYGGTSRTHRADTVVIAGTVAPGLDLYDALVAGLPGIPVTAAGDCTGLRLIQGATEDGARAACSIP